MENLENLQIPNALESLPVTLFHGKIMICLLQLIVTLISTLSFFFIITKIQPWYELEVEIRKPGKFLT